MPRLPHVAAAGLALLGACRPTPPAELRLGLIGIYDGPARLSSGLPAQQGAALAARELNAAGGVVIQGVPHRVVIVDKGTAARPDAAASVARELVNLDSVDAIIGPQTSSLAEAAGAVAEASDVPLIAPMASAAPVTAGRTMVTRLAFLDAVQGRVLADFAFDSLRLRRVAAIHNAASSYGRDIVGLFTRQFADRGGVVTSVETYDADAPETRQAALRRAAAGRPAAILMPNFSVRDSLELRTLRRLGFTGRLLGSDAWDAILLDRKDDALGTILTANWDRRADRPELQAFVRAFTAAHPTDRPRATAAATYDAVKLLAAAAARAGVRSGRPVVEALQRTGDYRGAFGQYRFVGTGDPVRSAVVLEVTRDSTILRAVVEPRP